MKFFVPVLLASTLAFSSNAQNNQKKFEENSFDTLTCQQNGKRVLAYKVQSQGEVKPGIWARNYVSTQDKNLQLSVCGQDMNNDGVIRKNECTFQKLSYKDPADDNNYMIICKKMIDNMYEFEYVKRYREDILPMEKKLESAASNFDFDFYAGYSSHTPTAPRVVVGSKLDGVY